MTDEWSRHGRPPGDHIVEVPLVDERSSDTADPAGPPALPNWRRALAIALVGGTAGGIVLSTVLLRDGDDDHGADTATATTAAAGDLSTMITTPPTLSALSTLPPPDDPSVSTRPLSSLPPARVVPTDVGVTVPSFPAVPGTDDAALAKYSIVDAVSMLGVDAARRSHTHLELGAGGFEMDVTIVRDPERDRYRLAIETATGTEIAIVDGATDTTYLNPGTNDRQDIRNADLIAGSGARDFHEFFDRFLLGPLRPETMFGAEVQGRGLVVLGDDDGVARRFVATIPGVSIPEWALYQFGPVQEFRDRERPVELEYVAYVDGDGRLARVDGVVLIGSIAQLIEHRIEVLEPPEPIDLPTSPVPATAPAPASDPAPAPAGAPSTSAG